MLTQPAIEKLCAMRLRGMAEAFREQQEKADYQQLSFERKGRLRPPTHQKLPRPPQAATESVLREFLERNGSECSSTANGIGGKTGH